jgi:hypothetical protein
VLKWRSDHQEADLVLLCPYAYGLLGCRKAGGGGLAYTLCRNHLNFADWITCRKAEVFETNLTCKAR